MRTSVSKTLLSSAALVAALAVPALAGPTKTAQSIQVNLHAEGSFAIVETQTFKYNIETAATYFTNAWDGGTPVLKQSQPGNSPCPPGAPPAAPAPDDNA